ncbi:MAG: bssD 1 [Firmicutes bacterium]|nr:bssD 1 [Bacillota bacterium]
MGADTQKYGQVFNIQKFSVHDGPGIRTIVFLKGCPLRCKWCSNPESQQCHSELAYNVNKCIGAAECGRCIKACPQGAFKAGTAVNPVLDRQLCKQCFKCVKVCPAAAVSIFGNLMSINDVLQVVEADQAFYSRSGGGLTISGGEPLLQAEFTIRLLEAAKRRRINTAIETSGFTDWSVLEAAAKHLDTIIYDLKCLDSKLYKQWIEVPNEVIVSNFKKLCAAFPKLPILVRTPIIPGFNDSKEVVLGVANLLKGFTNVKYELLPYHRLGQPKYEYLGAEYLLGETKLDEDNFNQLQAVVKEALSKLAPQTKDEF